MSGFAEFFSSPSRKSHLISDASASFASLLPLGIWSGALNELRTRLRLRIEGMNKRSQGKASAKKQRKKAAVASKILAKGKKKAVKVVDVRLGKQTGTKEKRAARKQTAKATRSKSVTQPKAAAREAQRLEVEASVVKPDSNQPAFITPTKALLRPFREAAKRNRKLALEAERRKKSSRSFLKKLPKVGLKTSADLRVHSPATRGYFSVGGVEPAVALVRLALAKKLDLIGLTDYYSADFVDLVRSAADGLSLTVLPGFDVRCNVAGCDDVTLTVLFPETAVAADIDAALRALGVPETAKGERDYVLQLPLEKIIEIIESRGGIIIPTRLDKTPYRQLAIPELVEKFGFHVFDLVHPENPEFFKRHWPRGEFTFFSFSNANALGQIGSRSAKLRLATQNFAGIAALVRRRNSDFLIEQ